MRPAVCSNIVDLESGAVKVLTVPPATAPATCTSCAKTAPCTACAYCERPACEGCARRCEACDGLFCAVCSPVDYQARYERVVCLSCAEDAARNAGDAMDM